MEISAVKLIEVKAFWQLAYQQVSNLDECKSLIIASNYFPADTKLSLEAKKLRIRAILWMQ